MTIRILFAAYQTDRGSNGGMESATRIFEALAGEFRWTLMTNRGTPRTERWIAGGAEVLRFAFDEEAGLAARGLGLGLASLRALARSTDILHGNDIRAAQILLPAARLTGRPFAFTLRDTKPEGQTYGANWHRVARELDALVTLSDDMARLVGERLPVPAARRHTISSIVDLAAFRPRPIVERMRLRAKLGIDPDEIALGLVAGVTDKKRQLEAIRYVMPQLTDLPVRLHFVGDFSPDTDAYARDCWEAVVTSGLPERVLFHGFRRDVSDWMAAFDILLIASRREGLARCMIEAMACGTPVISVDVSSAREMLEATGSGVVVGPDDWPGLAKAVRRLAVDSQWRESIGKAGRAAAEVRFSDERVADDWRELYTKLATAGLD